jgi:hypothetical protein
MDEEQCKYRIILIYMSRKFITVSPYHYTRNAPTQNGEKLSGVGLDIDWRGFTWDEYHRAIVCDDLETHCAKQIRGPEGA